MAFNGNPFKTSATYQSPRARRQLEGSWEILYESPASRNGLRVLLEKGGVIVEPFDFEARGILPGDIGCFDLAVALSDDNANWKSFRHDELGNSKHSVALRHLMLDEGVVLNFLRHSHTRRDPIGYTWSQLNRPEFSIRREFWTQVYRDVAHHVLIGNSNPRGERKSHEEAEVLQHTVAEKPLSTSPEDLFKAYRQAGAPIPLTPQELKQQGFREEVLSRFSSSLKIPAWVELHRGHCSLCSSLKRGTAGTADKADGKPTASGIHPDCYFRELIVFLTRGFTLPLAKEVEENRIPPKHGRKIKIVDEDDRQLLKDRRKEDEWNARCPLKDTPFEASEVWVAPSFVARNRLFNDLKVDTREPRVVTALNETINDHVRAPSFALVTVGDIVNEIGEGGLLGAIDLTSAFFAGSHRP